MYKSNAAQLVNIYSRLVPTGAPELHMHPPHAVQGHVMLLKAVLENSKLPWKAEERRQLLLCT